MRKLIMMALVGGALAVSGCQMTQTERSVVGGVAGAAGGLAVGNLLGANTNWTILTTIAGAAAGTLLAQNTRTGQCAYARGDGTYYEAPCP
ncbi:glycine zipper 2TM domain-containing protein [Roseinatronobacter sp. S2]|uniref:glycine zipper 2TM domain-containing protein n=1 Tax=Roseinatronobacter sp. S2 TaxID=3035471 RepID=UPI00240FE748|nr:glycine zipper 2TM domain-containing protein [Roseinatronobacter sp. S2]WFE75227.1 glycine zipper 2TM domain-containing protein [Roseinatronobacter sp. S2]